MINWDTNINSLQYQDKIKKIYDIEIRKNRKNFTSWIGKISEKYYKDNINWHISTPASRNPFESDLYKNICITKTFSKLLKLKKIFKVTVYTKQHFNLLNSIKKKKKIKLIYKNNNNYFLFIKNFCKSLIFQIIILLFVNFFVKKRSVEKKVTLIDFFCIEDNFYNNRYYGQVATKNYLKNKNILFVPTFIIGKGIIQTLKRIYGLKNNKNILFKEHFLNFKDIILSLSYYKDLDNFKKKYNYLDKIDYSKLIFEEIKNYKNVNTILISKLNYYFIKKLSRENSNKKNY